MSNSQVVKFTSAISNAQSTLKYSFFWPQTKLILEVLKILKKEGYISHFRLSQVNKKSFFEVFLKHGNNGEKSNSFKLISKPSLDKYFSKRDVWKFSTKVGVFILSTPFGILSDREAKSLSTGGKVLLYVC